MIIDSEVQAAEVLTEAISGNIYENTKLMMTMNEYIQSNFKSVSYHKTHYVLDTLMQFYKI